MENSWRLRPIQGNICPTCSISHFPFCPQSLAFDRNGFSRDNLQRFPLDPNPTFHKPFYDPFPVNRPMAGPLSHFDLRPNSNPIPGNDLGSSQSWNRSQLLEREPFGAVDFEIHGPGFQPTRFDNDRGLLFREQFDERRHKKAKVNDMSLGPFTQITPQLPVHSDYVSNAPRISSEDQRLLNLIRDHGGQSKPQSQVGVGLSFESGVNIGSVGFTDVRNRVNVDSIQRSGYDYQTDRYSYESSLHERRLDNFNAGEHAGLEDQRSNSIDCRSNRVANNFDHLGVGSDARQGPVLPPEPLSFNQRNHFANGANCNFPEARNSQNINRVVLHESNEFRSGGYKIDTGRQRMQSNYRDGFPSEMDYPSRTKDENSKGALYNSQNELYHHGHFTQNYRHGDITTGALNYAEPVHQSGQDSAAICREDYGAQGSYENFRAYDHPPLQSKEFSSCIPAKQSQYPHSATWQGPNVQQQDQRNSYLPVDNHLSNTLPPHPVYAMQNHVENKHEFYGQQNEGVTPFERKAVSLENIQRPVEPEKSDARNTNIRGGYSFIQSGSSMTSSMAAYEQASQEFAIRPSFPPLPPQPPSKEPPGPSPSHFQPASVPPTTCSPLYPVPVSSSATAPSSFPSAIQGFHEVQSSSQAYFNKPLAHASTGFATAGSQSIHQAPSEQYGEGGQSFLSKHCSPDKPKVIDAAHLFRLPHRVNRPDHIVIILRGLPGSGKSYLAKVLRDLEVENGGNAPRIHSMDDYFMIEVEKVEESAGSKSSSSAKGKKRITKKVMEYCYEPEMEEVYRSSMLKAFKKTLEEGIFTFIIVDDRNLRVADFAQFWAIAKRSGYEVYLLEATYKDPMGCAARNVHGFTSDDIQKMADQWEQAPPMYLQLDIQLLFHGDDLNEHGIQEIDMDMEDAACDEDGISGVQDREAIETIELPVADYDPDDSFRAGERWDAERDDPAEGVKELGRSKWSEDVDEDIEKTEGAKRNLNALSGLIQAYSKGEKSVRWGDQVGKSGFSIGAAKKAHMSSLLIGPGAGYNLDSNPLPEDNADAIGKSNITEPKKRTAFLEQLRAERESFRVVFDRRRQRISGLQMDDD